MQAGGDEHTMTDQSLKAAIRDSSSVDEDFVLSVPNSIDLAEAGPLLCTGITTYFTLRHWSVAPGKKVAIAGLGGLRH